MKKEEIIEIFKNTVTTESDELANLVNTIDYNKIEETVMKIANCSGKIIVTACGTSAVAAKKIVHSLSCISIPAVYLNPSDAVHGSLGIVKDDDVVICISKGGNTEELATFIPNVKKKGAYIIGVTENDNSKIANSSDLTLKVKVDKEPDKFNMLATASTLAVISVFDGIILSLMQFTNFDKKEFLSNHPGGAVGKRLAK